MNHETVERKRISNSKPVLCWFIGQIIKTWRHVKHIHGLFIFFFKICFLQMQKETVVDIKSRKKQNELFREEKCTFIFECMVLESCHSTSSLPLPASGPVTSASASFSGSCESEGSGWDVSIGSSASSGWGDGVSIILANSTWRGPRMNLDCFFYKPSWNPYFLYVETVSC